MFSRNIRSQNRYYVKYKDYINQYQELKVETIEFILLNACYSSYSIVFIILIVTANATNVSAKRAKILCDNTYCIQLSSCFRSLPSLCFDSYRIYLPYILSLELYNDTTLSLKHSAYIRWVRRRTSIPKLYENNMKYKIKYK